MRQSYFNNKGEISLVCRVIINSLLPGCSPTVWCRSDAVSLWVRSMEVSFSSTNSEPLQCRQNERNGVSHHQRLNCLLNRSFRRRSKKTPKNLNLILNLNLNSASLAFVRGIHRTPVDSPRNGPVTQKMFPLDNVFMLRSASVIAVLYGVYFCIGTSCNDTLLYMDLIHRVLSFLLQRHKRREPFRCGVMHCHKQKIDRVFVIGVPLHICMRGICMKQTHKTKYSWKI